MSFPTSGRAPTTGASAPTPPASTAGPRVLAEFSDYAAAQQLVDRLSDAGFPVEHVRIVGTGIHSVEQVTGRLTVGRAALAGAASGAWFGLLIGLLFAIFTIGLGWLFVVLWSVLLGAVFGAVFGAIAHAASGGRRDFASVKALQAETYSVQVDAAHADEAARILSRA
ncbi:general stress protein [Quadrisphaera sp. DSM 44207]|uniref:general stress protein n=1 Tax=Quadrisphaera sp. DSM 44207 TaxID=1881057 RepID=UPI00087E3A51|nr:general stress protein [Quadrisphaera sp. DSM 44207]SDQ41588.1 hypothetical protein SAMN05428996_1616 [Quadrisphaera sp. DSM 44207]